MEHKPDLRFQQQIQEDTLISSIIQEDGQYTRCFQAIGEELFGRFFSEKFLYSRLKVVSKFYFQNFSKCFTYDINNTEVS